MMASAGPYRFLLALVAVLITFTNALSIYERNDSPLSYGRSLIERDGPFDPPLPPCIPPCGPGCAGPYLNDEPPTALKKRDFEPVFAGPAWSPLNSQDLIERNLFKVTAGNVDSFIKNKVVAKTTVPLIFDDADGTSTSTTVQHEFDDNKYELGTGGLTGCSVLTIVSRRAVFMAHFFESLAFSRPTKAQLIEAGEDPDTYPRLNFVGQVTNLIDQSRGATVGIGPSLDVSLFNNAGDGSDDPGDNTKAFIMTPRKWNGAEGEAEFTNKINSIITQVKGLLPNLGDVPIYDYVRLNMADEAEEAELYTNARGSAFFQYDPSNRGKKAWRLFYERELAGKGTAEDSW